MVRLSIGISSMFMYIDEGIIMLIDPGGIAAEVNESVRQGTIVVSVALEVMKQIDAQLSMYEY